MSLTLHPSRIALTQEARLQLERVLNPLLANCLMLASHLKQAHWTLRSPDFIALHELLDRIHGVVAEISDEIAERIATLGCVPEGTVHAVVRASALPDYPMHLPDGMAHLAAVADRLAAVITEFRHGLERAGTIGDPLTQDLLTARARDLEHQLWLLEAHGI